MAEYIERGAVLGMLKQECSPMVFAYLADLVNDIPAADVRPVVHGTWIPVMAHYTNGRVEQAREEAYSPLFKCSECGFEWISYDDINFCPKCGAMMEKS